MGQADIAKKIAQKFFDSGLLPEDDVEVMAYYLENIISLATVVFTILLIAVLSDTLVISGLYFLTFFVGRHCCGGYHAKTHLHCYILTMLTYGLFLAVKYVFDTFEYSNIIAWSMVIGFNLLILAFAPVDTANKPFTPKERKRYRQKSLMLLLTVDLGYGFAVVNGLSHWLFPIVFAIFQVSASITVEKVLQSRNSVAMTK